MTSADATEVARRAVRVSLVITLGPGEEGSLEAVHAALEATAGREDVEILVIEDGCTEEVQAQLRALSARVLVAHCLGHYGLRRALGEGIDLARGEVVILVGAKVALRACTIEGLLEPFADPGIAVALGHEPALALVALRRCAVASMSFGEVAEGDDPSPLLPRFVLEELLAGRWRIARVPVDDANAPSVVPWPGRYAPDRSSRRRWSPVVVPRQPSAGVNVIGLLEAACGIGDAARRYVEAIAATRVPVSTFAYHGHGSPQFPYLHHGDGRFGHDTNLIVLNNDILDAFVGDAGAELWSNRYTIGMWFWELEALHPQMSRHASLFHELWVSSKFLAHAFSRHLDLPVRTMPMPVQRHEGAPAISRRALALPERFIFLSIFDFASLAVRKNSLGAVRAFCRAFAPGEGPVLVLKTLNQERDPQGVGALRAAIGERRDVLLLDGYLGDDELAALSGLADCFVSLHRAEGFGLMLAEAMAWGRPVIATGYSGNLDFMSRENSCLVSYELTPVPDAVRGIYPLGAAWAEPSLDEAAAAMRLVYCEPQHARALGARAQRDIRATNSREASARAIKRRLEEISQGRRQGAPTTRRAS